MTEEFIEDVYYSLLGEMAEQAKLPWVESAFVPGSICERNYEAMYEARGRLCDRLGSGCEDNDVETVINALLENQKELCCSMFRHGVKYGRGDA